MGPRFSHCSRIEWKPPCRRSAGWQSFKSTRADRRFPGQGQVFKFLEDMAKPASQPAGRAVFTNDFPINRVREIVGPVPAPLGWINKNRDPNLEQAILAGIRDALFL